MDLVFSLLNNSYSNHKSSYINEECVTCNIVYNNCHCVQDISGDMQKYVIYVVHQQDRLFLSQLRLTFPSCMDGAGSQNRSKLPHPSELDNRTPPATSDRAQFDTKGLNQSEAFPPLSPFCSDIDNKRDITLHIKVSVSVRSRHLVTRHSPRHFVALCSEVGAVSQLLFQAVVD